ncbi:MAG: sigma-70 family RNA polymerase sigma factor [Pirellulaceae bacterium]|nr:sigma-70 family RNA polymerase sigma factor [Pirellulaceae bacterium]
MTDNSSGQIPGDMPRQFATTRWSMVARARGGTPYRARVALDELCRAYWYPVYSFVRRKGLDSNDALDVTQSFFARFVEQDFFDQAAPQQGRLRSYLLKAVQNHFISMQRAASAKKRAPATSPISLDQVESERRYHLEPTNELTAERAFERQWALAVIEQAMSRLHAELTDKLGAQHSDQIVRLLTGQAGEVTLAEVATELQTTEAALKVRMHRIRGRYRQLLRTEVADTVGENVDVDEELRNLLEVL